MGCGGITSGADGGDGKDGGPDAVQPPPANVCPSGQTCTATFVLRELLLGESPRQGGAPSQAAWKGYGENIDGKVTDRNATDVCKRAAGAGSFVQTDGADGIDNSWGANILPIWQSAGSLPNPTASLTSEIANGNAATLLVTIETGPAGTTGKLYVAAPLGKSASFDGSDVWPTTQWPFQSIWSVLDYPNASVLPDGTFVSGRSLQRFAIAIQLAAGTSPMLLLVDQLQVRMRLGAGLRTATAGTLSGVMPIEPFVAQLRSDAGRISKSLCGAAFDGIAQQLRLTGDILGDGTNTAGVACDAISLGLGFEVAPATLGSPVALVQPGDPCK